MMTIPMRSTVHAIATEVACGITGCSKDEPVSPSETIDNVHFVSRTSGTFLNRPSSIIKLELRASDLESGRSVEVRVMNPSVESKGAWVLTSGGHGISFYGIGSETNTTLNYAPSPGLETFEVRWLGDRGWGTGIAGAGYPKAERAYASIVQYLKEKEITNLTLIIAHAGSGGSFQIVYSLTRFGLEKYINYAILVAGPPTADLRQAIFGDKTLNSY